MKTKTHWKKAFDSDYLSSSDIDDRDLDLTINKVVYQECLTQSGKKNCNVAYFKENGVKPMILNVTNSKVIKKFSGNKTHLEDWVDIRITVYVDSNVRFGSDTVEGLRIRPVQKKVSNKLVPLTEELIPNAINVMLKGKTIADIKTKYSMTPEVESKLKQAADEAGV